MQKADRKQKGDDCSDAASEEPAPVVYPNPKSLYSEAIKEQVPVFEEKVRITQVTVSPSKIGNGIRAVF